jgi:hypothetical protein
LQKVFFLNSSATNSFYDPLLFLFESLRLGKITE